MFELLGLTLPSALQRLSELNLSHTLVEYIPRRPVENADSRRVVRAHKVDECVELVVCDFYTMECNG